MGDEVGSVDDGRRRLCGALGREQRVVAEPARREQLRGLGERADPVPDQPLAVAPDEVLLA